MSLIQAQHMTSQPETLGEQRVGRRRQTVAVIDCVDGCKCIAASEFIICPEGTEIFPDGLLWIVVRERNTARQAIHEQLRAVRDRPKRHVLQDRRVQVRSRTVNTACIRQQTLTRLLIGNDSDIAQPEPLAKSLIVAEHEQAVFLKWASQCPAELVSLEGRKPAAGARLIKKIS